MCLLYHINKKINQWVPRLIPQPVGGQRTGKVMELVEWANQPGSLTPNLKARDHLKPGPTWQDLPTTLEVLLFRLTRKIQE